MRPGYLLNRHLDLHRTEDRRRHGKGEQDRAVEPGKVVTVLPMRLLEIELAEKERRIEVKPRQPELAVMIPRRHVDIFDPTEIGNEAAKLWPLDMSRNEPQVILLRDIKVGLMLDQIPIRAKIADSGSLRELLPGASYGRLAQEKVFPEMMRQQVPGDWLDEYPIMDPYQVQTRIFRDKYLTPFYSLSMKRFDVRAGLCRHDP